MFKQKYILFLETYFFKISKNLIGLAFFFAEADTKKHRYASAFADCRGEFRTLSNTVKHDILLSKLEHHFICGLANDWFKSYLSNRKQYVSINGYDSNLADVNLVFLKGQFLVHCCF